jgi:hypothetical protein
MIKIFFFSVFIIMIVSCTGTDSGPNRPDHFNYADISLEDCKSRRKPNYTDAGCSDFRWTKNQNNDLGYCELYNCR